MELEDNYQLSCEILGHSADVRVTKSFHLDPSMAREHLLTASRDGTGCVWKPEEGSHRQYVLKKVMKQHTGYVSALSIIPAHSASLYGQTTRMFPLVLNIAHYKVCVWV